VEDISVIQQKLIGISFLPDPEKEKVRTIWNDRFRENEAFLVSFDTSATAVEISLTLYRMIADQGYTSMAGQHFVLALFYDLSEDSWKDRAAEVKHLIKKIETGTTGTVSHVIQFGYLGQMPYLDPVSLQQHTAMLLAQNEHPLCLVASHALTPGGGHNWKAVSVFLDIMRRKTTSVLPLTNYNERIGFLRYAEHDEKRRAASEQELEHIKRILGTDGSLELKSCAAENLKGLEQRCRQQFDIKGTAQPIHPHMHLKGRIEKWKAKRGKSALFNAAAQETGTAMELTGKNLLEEIRAEYTRTPEEITSELVRMFDEIGAGAAVFSEEKQVLQALNVDIPAVRRPVPPVFLYNETGMYQDIIHDYLKDWLEYAIHTAKKDRIETWLAHCPPILQTYARKTDTLLERRQLLTEELNNIPDRAEFVKSVVGDGSMMHSCFRPIVGTGTTSRFVLAHKDGDKELLSTHADGISCFISEQHGGLTHTNDAELKAVHALFFVYDDVILDNLIV